MEELNNLKVGVSNGVWWDFDIFDCFCGSHVKQGTSKAMGYGRWATETVKLDSKHALREFLVAWISSEGTYRRQECQAVYKTSLRSPEREFKCNKHSRESEKVCNLSIPRLAFMFGSFPSLFLLCFCSHWHLTSCYRRAAISLDIFLQKDAFY